MLLGDVVVCAMSFGFFRLIVSPKTVHAKANRSIKDCRCDGLYAATLESFENSMYFIIVLLTFDLLSNKRY